MLHLNSTSLYLSIDGIKPIKCCKEDFVIDYDDTLPDFYHFETVKNFLLLKIYFIGYFNLQWNDEIFNYLFTILHLIIV